MFLKDEETIKYTSKKSKNAIIESCNSVSVEKIVARVSDAKLADETTDISGTEQISNRVRFIDFKKLYDFMKSFDNLFRLMIQRGKI